MNVTNVWTRAELKYKLKMGKNGSHFTSSNSNEVFGSTLILGILVFVGKEKVSLRVEIFRVLNTGLSVSNFTSNGN
jgi:hypothetical protein